MNSSTRPTLDEMMRRAYPIRIDPVLDQGAPEYWIAYLPDFGVWTCSATGDRPEDAITRLNAVKVGVFQHYLETGRKIPLPFDGDKTP